MKHSFKILIVLMGFSAAAFASVLPSNSRNAPSNDPFMIYQWALWNSGQKVMNDIDDIHPKELIGNPQIQIGWKPSFDTRMKRDVVVAVIDSGLDLDHEDIQGHVALNTAECKDGNLTTGPTGDPDKNGFDGDCMGWNFAARDKKQGKLVDDDLGHGTHIAGIIAAVSGNSIGISGVSNRIKILPLKVYTASEENSVGGAAPVQKQESISDRVAKALDYAVLRKVDVINLSLGWPLVNNSEKVKNALKNALDHDILVVAGAGNDRHEAQIYPCALEGVVCVGSVDIDGQVSRFSNFGGHVDVVAPGDNILSLWPTALTNSSTVFGPKGYEVLSGTSQATPYVSGVLAVLRGIYPDLSARDLRAKLLASAAPAAANTETFTLRGLINLEKAISINTDGVVLPSFKEFDHAIVNSQTGEFTLPVRLNNYGHSTKGSKITVYSLNSQVSFPNADQSVSIAGNGSAVLSIKGKVQSLKASATLRYQVMVNDQTFTHQILLSQDLMQNSQVQTYMFGDNPPTSALSSVKMLGSQNAVPEYFTVEKSAEGADKTTTVKIYRLAKNGSQGQMVMAGALVLPKVSDLIGISPVIKADLNGDGKADYFISGLLQDKDGNAMGLQFGYFSSNFKELFPGSGAISLQYEDAILDGNTLRFVTVPTKEFGSIALPVFWATGGVPTADRDPDPFNFEPISVQARRLYFYELERTGTGGVDFKTRIFDNFQLYKNLRKQLGIQVVEDLNLHTTLGQNLSDFSQGIVRVMGSYGTGVIRKYFQLKVQGAQLLNHSSQILKMTVPGLDLQRQGFDDTLNYSSSSKQADVGTDLIGIFSVTRARTIVFDDQTQSTTTLTNMDVQTSDPEEHLRGHIKTFAIDRQPISFFEGDTRLVAQGSYQNKNFHAESQIYRSSFLPGAYFTQRFYPVLISDTARGASFKKPGLFVDNSKVFSTTAEIWTLNEKNQLIVPLALSYSLPENCMSMNPSRWGTQDVAVILCQADGKAQKMMFMGL
jgi:subtilisin family serine protease